MDIYQEALNTIKSIVWFDKRFEEFYKDELNILQQNIDDLELYKKAFEYSCNVLSTNSMFHIKNNRLENINSNASADWQNYFKNVAQKELENEIQNI